MRTDHARVPGLAAVENAWSICNSFDMPTSQILAFSDRSSRTVARTHKPVSMYVARMSLTGYEGGTGIMGAVYASLTELKAYSLIAGYRQARTPLLPL